MGIYSITILCILSAVITCSFLHFFLPFLRRRFLDLPNERSSHIEPIPRGGGISFVFISFVSLIAVCSGRGSAFVSVPLLCGPLAVVGFLDDFEIFPHLGVI